MRPEVRWRVIVGFALVATLTVLAGCSYAAHTLHFKVETVESTDGGFDLMYTVWKSDVDFTFHNVSVHGYGPNGTLLCKSTVGTVRPNQSYRGRLYCSGLPHVIALDAEESDTDTDNPSGVRIPIYGYAGYNETKGHQWEFVRRREMVERGDVFRKKSLPPNRTLFERIKCQQRVSDANVSALGTAPWMNADLGEPNVERDYGVYLTNASDRQKEKQTIRFEDPPEVIGSLIREFESQNQPGSWARTKLSRAAWLDFLSAFEGERVTNPTDLPTGHFDSYRRDTRGERCWGGGGDYGGKLEVDAEYTISVDGRIYYLNVRYLEKWY